MTANIPSKTVSPQLELSVDTYRLNKGHGPYTVDAFRAGWYAAAAVYARSVDETSSPPIIGTQGKPLDTWDWVEGCIQELEWFASRKKNLAEVYKSDSNLDGSTWGDMLLSDAAELRTALRHVRGLPPEEPSARPSNWPPVGTRDGDGTWQENGWRPDSQKPEPRRCIHGKAPDESCDPCWQMGGKVYESPEKPAPKCSHGFGQRDCMIEGCANYARPENGEAPRE